MSQEQEAAAAPRAATADEALSATENFTLQVVSPSAGVEGPLLFPQLPQSTTVKQLKERIRAAIPTRPLDDHQRLIHRGRLLARDTETMSEVFGFSALQNSASHTIHLVLRPLAPDDTTLQTVASQTVTYRTDDTRPDGSIIPQVTPTSEPPRMPTLPSFARTTPDPSQNGTVPHQNAPNHAHHHNGYDQAPPPVLSVVQRLQQLQHQGEQLQQIVIAQQQRNNQHHQQAAANLQQAGFALPGLTPVPTGLSGNPVPGRPPVGDPSFRDRWARYQRDLLAMGYQGSQQPNANVAYPGGYAQTQPQFGSIIHRPDQTTTYTQEGRGPNGERWQVTVNETTRTVSTGTIPPPLQAGDVANILRAADQTVHQSFQRLQTDALSRVNAPATSIAGDIARPTSAPSGPSFPTASSGAGNAPLNTSVSTPSLNADSQASSDQLQANSNASTRASSLTGPMVYILSSPSGPRALLIDDSQVFYTPRRTHLLSEQQSRTDAGIANIGGDQIRNRRENRAERHARRQAAAAAPVEPGPALLGAHPANPNAGAVAAQMAPHIWLIIRLLGFVWFFTSGNSTWWRWIMVSSVAVIVFIVQTGVFNGIAEQLWGPVRRHLEVLLPLAGPNAPPVPAVDDAGAVPPRPEAIGQEQGARVTSAPPDPAQAAQRLLDQRRQANGNWLWTQMRRAEHATLLFLASLVPGVGERHIAAREAEANLLADAERQRLEALNAALEPASGDSGADTRQDSIQGAEENLIGESGPSASQEHPDAGDGNNGAGPAVGPAQPVIEV